MKHISHKNKSEVQSFTKEMKSIFLFYFYFFKCLRQVQVVEKEEKDKNDSGRYEKDMYTINWIHGL